MLVREFHNERLPNDLIRELQHGLHRKRLSTMRSGMVDLCIPSNGGQRNNLVQHDNDNYHHYLQRAPDDDVNFNIDIDLEDNDLFFCV